MNGGNGHASVLHPASPLVSSGSTESGPKDVINPQLILEIKAERLLDCDYKEKVIRSEDGRNFGMEIDFCLR